jgi:aspartate racemase
MQEDFYRQRLAERFAIEVITPNAAQMTEIDRVIFTELCQGQFLPQARDFYLACLRVLQGQGAEVAILGCTEIGLLLDGVQAPLPLLDSTALHVAMGLEWMLDDA